jgi:hypothetical protein
MTAYPYIHAKNYILNSEQEINRKKMNMDSEENNFEH